MGFLDKIYSGPIAARLTQKGRESIANGNFVITHFAVGDSEYSYVDSVTGQTIMAPFDDYSNVKYPLSYVSGSSPYGIPVSLKEVVECSNVMGPAGFVSGSLGGNFVIKSNRETINSFTGNTNSITVATGSNYQTGSFITLALNGNKLNNDSITGQTNSLVYKVTATGSTSITLDRTIPTLPSTNVVVIQNDDEFENPVPTGTTEQHNPWTLNVVWDEKPIGLSGSSITDYTSNTYIGTKEFFGYKNSEGQTYNTGTTISNTLGDLIKITPEEQKVIALIHYSKNGDIIDPNRFFKYDDHISVSDTPTEPNDITDEEYFQVHIPFLMYHRNTGTTVGAVFHMGPTDKEIVSSYNSRFVLNYRDLLDEQNIRVGKIFYNQQAIVFDDEEIVAALDYKSNRKFTLPAPKVAAIITNDPILDLTTGHTLWVTYMLSYSGDTKTNNLPCNYFMKVSGSTTPHSVSVKFDSGEFQFLQTTTGNTINGHVANQFKILYQLTTGNTPSSNIWYEKDYTPTLVGGLIDPSTLANKTFTINNSDYTGFTYFNLTSYRPDLISPSGHYFGDEQPFPGSVNVVRGTEIQTLTFRANLPSQKFTTSVNPTYISGSIMITEVALLNSNKETLVMGKMSEPLPRSGDQIIDVQLDF
jgi:hypothetical protein